MQILNQLIKFPGTTFSRCVCYIILTLWLGYGLPISHSVARADSSLEYQVKAAFIYNFIAFTHWPNSVGQTIRLCVYGEDYFGHEIDKLQNRLIDKRHINVARINDLDQFNDRTRMRIGFQFQATSASHQGLSVTDCVLVKYQRPKLTPPTAVSIHTVSRNMYFLSTISRSRSPIYCVKIS